jgi:hypothetical protein
MDVPHYSTWRVSMQFHDFKELWAAIERPLYKAVPSGLTVPFPAAGWTKTNTDKLKTERQMALDGWLRCLLSSGLAMGTPEIHTVLWKFLKVREHLNMHAAPVVGSADIEFAPRQRKAR